ncbi:class I SAM-dependent methyltransferase [Candidatus Parcubacteria bacterium]|nr:class I SAM-dependent methyltransferase [Candidatus Parcubacteria bacterium]
MSKQPKSPITNLDNTILDEEIDALPIINVYKSEYGIDVGKYFKETGKIKIYKCLDTGYRFYYPFSMVGDGSLYDLLQKDPYYYMPQKWEYDIVLDQLDIKDDILEVGCGEGYFLDKLKEKNIKACGLEMNKGAIKECEEKQLSVSEELLKDHLNSRAEPYDAICSFQVLEHIPNVRSFINDLSSAVRPGGKIFIGVPNNDSFIKQDKLNYLNLPPHHMGLWNEQALRSLPKYFNFDLVDIFYEPLPKYHANYYYKVNIGQKLLKFGLLGKLGSKIFNLPAYILLSLLSNKLQGSNIVAVYKKR